MNNPQLKGSWVSDRQDNRHHERERATWTQQGDLQRLKAELENNERDLLSSMDACSIAVKF
jgi:hypothetical protein